MIKINLNYQNAVEWAAFPLYISIDLIVKPVSAGFLWFMLPFLWLAFWRGMPAGTDTLHTCTGFGAVAEGMEFNTWPCCCLSAAGWKPACH